MFKKVTGNDNLLISLSGTFVTLDGQECTPPSHGNTLVEVEIYGKLEIVCKEWLAMLSHFEVDLPVGFRHRLRDIRFTPANKFFKTISLNGQLMVFSKPITFKPGFRLIPGFTNYAVSQDGRVLEVSSGKFRNVHVPPGSMHYPYVYVRHPTLNRSDTAHLHRLIALAWIPNDNWLVRFQVNHIDGIKSNSIESNLEWVSARDNINHAVETGLRNDNIRCKARHYKTGEIIEEISLVRLFDRIGLSRQFIRSIRNRPITSLYGAEWEVRVDGDDRPWYYIDRDPLPIGGQSIIHVTMPDGEKKVFYDNRDFLKDLKLWNVGGGLPNLIEKAEMLYPGIKVEIEKRHVYRPIEIKELATGAVHTEPTLRAAARRSGISRLQIKLGLRDEGRRSVKGFAFRHATDEPWPSETFSTSFVPKCILATNVETGAMEQLQSLRGVSRLLGIDKKTASNRLRDGKPINGWVVKEVATNSPPSQ